jgi:hypothetical protein
MVVQEGDIAVNPGACRILRRPLHHERAAVVIDAPAQGIIPRWQNGERPIDHGSMSQ